jgi:hypothetical protein
MSVTAACGTFWTLDETASPMAMASTAAMTICVAEPGSHTELHHGFFSLDASVPSPVGVVVVMASLVPLVAVVLSVIGRTSSSDPFASLIVDIVVLCCYVDILACREH